MFRKINSSWSFFKEKNLYSLTLPVHWIKIWARLAKLRLTLLVLFSSLVSYFTIAGEPCFYDVLYLTAGGLFITAASNTFNQYYEAQTDAMMERTKTRPLPSGLINSRSAVMIGVFNALLGLCFLSLLGIVPLAFGALSFIMYVYIYTPMKKKNPWAVFIGAFPGSFPVLIGALASEPNDRGKWLFSFILFLIQFIWQFPHFWSLAWFNFDDYARAGFFLLPTGREKNRSVGFQVLIYSIFLVVISVFPFFLNLTGIISALSIMICGVALIWQSFLFYRHPDDLLARRLFLISLVYLPVVQLSLLTGV
ncbi:MAG: heme o synthase [Bacteroidia bacterium]|nr:heme o synthase [Bacteroidia bacterium]